jgi:hypothetical protein
MRTDADAARFQVEVRLLAAITGPFSRVPQVLRPAVRRVPRSLVFLIRIAAHALRYLLCKEGGDNNENRKIILGRFASGRFAGSY